MSKPLALVIGVFAVMNGAFASSLAGQFGLNCAGMSVDGMRHTSETFRTRMSVDLDRKEFCLLPDCKELFQLAHVTDDEIRLFDRPIASDYLVATVNRTSGAYRLVMQSSFANVYISGICDRSAFTPFATNAKLVDAYRSAPSDRVVTAPPLPLP